MTWQSASASAPGATAAPAAGGTELEERARIVRAVAQSVSRDLCLQARRTARGGGFAWSEF